MKGNLSKVCHHFKIGDEVICVDNTELEDILVLDKTYTVKDIYEKHVVLSNSNEKYHHDEFFAWRFTYPNVLTRKVLVEKSGRY